MRHSMKQPILFPRPSRRVDLSHARRLRFEYRKPPEWFLPSRRDGK